MPYSDKTQFSSWPHSPSSGASVAAGTASPKAGWLGNLTTISEWLDWAWGAFRAATGHTHTGADGDGPQIPTGGITDLAVTTGKIAANAVTSAKVDSTVVTNAFKTIAVSGQDNVVADSATDTLTIAAGSNVTITTTAGSDTVTIAATVPVASVNGETGAVSLSAADVGAAPSSHVGAGGAEHANAIAAGAAGFMTGADKTKLDGVTSGATASSIAKNGSAAITGAATLSEGTAITLTQVGSDISIATTAMSNPMTTAGDLIVGGTAGAPARLAKGADGTVLTMAAGAETWATPASAPVSSVFGRTGAVAATSGDYTAALVTNAADKSSVSTQAFTGEVSATAVTASGLTGATSGTRLGGGTAAGAPTTGTWAVRDVVTDANAVVWICTAAGTPGTWVRANDTAPRASASHSATQSISSGAWNTVALDSETFDTDTMHDAATNNERLTFKTAGTYLVVGYSGAFDAHATGIRKCGLFVDGNGTATTSMTIASPDGTNTCSLFAFAVIQVAANSYVDMKVYQTSGTSLNITGPSLAASRLGA